MAVLDDILPQAKSSVNRDYDHSNDPWFTSCLSGASVAVNAKQQLLPPYLKREGFKPEDLGDGGALPEVHYVQYPLGMGMGIGMNVDECGKLRHDTIVRQDDDMLEVYEKQREIDETTQRTKAALEQIISSRLNAVQPKKQSSDSKFIKYKLQSAAFNSGAKERIIRVVEVAVDPLEPPKLKHKRIPKGSSDSPPVPVMHSPPRPLTVTDQQEWSKIPPCISNWKNPKGYTIPLDKRLASDGRGLQEVQINENFAKLSEALYVGEQKAREAVAVRSKVQKEMMMKEKENKEMELRELAQKARSERTVAGTVPSANDGDMSVDYKRVRGETREEKDERIRREKIREERRRERGRERRLEAKDAGMGKRSKINRDRERDISEKVALGMASIGVGTKVMHDERLFNQEKGMDSGFGTDDDYNIYDKGLFTCSQSALRTSLYSRPKKDNDNDEEMYGGADNDGQLDKIKKTERFKVDMAFTGTNERSGRQRDMPVEFEKEEVAEEDEDLFGLDQFLEELKTGKKAIDKIGSVGGIH